MEGVPLGTYSAPAPWGPWTLFHTQDFEPQGFYNPSIPGKFISEDERKFWISTDFSDNAGMGEPFYETSEEGLVAHTRAVRTALCTEQTGVDSRATT